MVYYELKCSAYLKDNIHLYDTFDVISKFINYTMLSNSLLQSLHLDKNIKFYVFNTFNKIEKDKIYKKGKIYNFEIRSPNQELLKLLSKYIKSNVNNHKLLVVESNLKRVNIDKIESFTTLTPTIITVDSMFWTIKDNGDINILIKQLHNNLERKYNKFYNTNLNAKENFIETIQLLNSFTIPIKITKNKKDILLLGNKFKIKPKQDETSQKLAFMALSCGLGEKNSFGGGFCKRLVQHS